MTWRPGLGAWPDGDATRFRVWAPRAHAVTLQIEREGGEPERWPCMPGDDGLFEASRPRLPQGTRYRYRLDDGPPLPDPVSRWQPLGVHGPSAVVDPSTFAWTDRAWRGIRREDLVIYELHVGTFTPEGTFDGVRHRLPYLRDLGVTAIELMPLADFPGDRSWGYDGAALFAPARCYGTPDDLRRLVDAAHAHDLAIVLDVVYNHLGPDGAYAFAYSPYYFVPDAATPWGSAVNLAGEHHEQVRAFFLENALHWVHEYHVDGLRLDATHAMIDSSSAPFLAELRARVSASLADRPVLFIAEDERNLSHLVRPVDQGGFGLDAVWADDFHHQVRRHLTGDADGYFAAFSGSSNDIATTIARGWFYTGEHSVHTGARRGTPPDDLPYDRFVVCLQNHDQVGNRAHGDRLHHAVTPRAWRAATALLLSAPETPLLFMGQEWEASTPFLYFSDHHEALGRLVTEGRRREFSAFAAFRDPDTRERIPDPQARATFLDSRLRWDERDREPHASALAWHRALLRLRREEPALRDRCRGAATVRAAGSHTILIRRDSEGHPSLLTIAGLAGDADLDLRDLDVGILPTGLVWVLQHATHDSAAEDGTVDDAADVRRVALLGPGAVILRSGRCAPETTS